MASAHRWLLRRQKVVDDDDVAHVSAGTRSCLTYSRKPSPLMEPSRSWAGGHAAQPQPGNERGLLAVPVRDRRAQAHSSGRAAVQASHVGGGKALVDEHEFRRIEIELGFEPVLTSLHHVGGGPARRRAETSFSKVRPQRSRKVQIVPVLAQAPLSSIRRRRSSSMVASGAASITASRKSRWASSLEPGRRPCRRRRMLAAVAQTLDPHSIAVETPTSKRTAAGRADVPFPVASITLSLPANPDCTVARCLLCFHSDDAGRPAPTIIWESNPKLRIPQPIQGSLKTL